MRVTKEWQRYILCHITAKVQFEGEFFMYYVIFSSITYATWLKRSFTGDGSSIQITHTPKEISLPNCSYSLIVSESKFPEILKRAAELKIKILEAYKRLPNGSFERVGI